MTTVRTTTPKAGTRRAAGSWPIAVRTIAFRILAGLFALLLVVGFGAWRQILSPWFVATDSTDHGWPRTPELHLIADASAALLFSMIGTALVVCVLRPADSPVWPPGPPACSR
ncbi:hypothetical protein [Granulicoccus sp. GXG6511]|uniref:hypothetical protein n=1 Tax=Granulicoccus sp. GXG6511 TaxID=3381351 RepID=UPI003D7E4419